MIQTLLIDKVLDTFEQNLKRMNKPKNPEADTYYPATKSTYLNPESNADTSKARIGSDKVDLSNPDVAKARDDVKNLSSPTDWVVFGYEGLTSNKLKVVGSGDGGYEEMCEELTHATPMFMLLKVDLDGLKRIVYITWNPAAVPPVQKGLMHGRAWDIGKFLEPFHLQIDAQNESDMEFDKIMTLLRRAAGSK